MGKKNIFRTFKFWFYPVLYGRIFSAGAIAGYLTITVLCNLPILFNLRIMGRKKEGTIELIKP